MDSGPLAVLGDHDVKWNKARRCCIRYDCLMQDVGACHAEHATLRELDSELALDHVADVHLGDHLQAMLA